MFLKTADEQRFNIVNRLDADLLLEKYLPYAIVLGCELEWVENFRNAIAPALELEDEGIPKYYVPAGDTLATSALLGGALEKSENLHYHDYMRDKLTTLKATTPNLPKYPDIDIIRPRVSNKGGLFSAADNTSKIPKGRTSWSSDSYSSSDSSSSSSSSSSSASRGGGFSGGGAGGGGGW